MSKTTCTCRYCTTELYANGLSILQFTGNSTTSKSILFISKPACYRIVLYYFRENADTKGETDPVLKTLVKLIILNLIILKNIIFNQKKKFYIFFAFFWNSLARDLFKNEVLDSYHQNWILYEFFKYRQSLKH